MIKVKVTGTNQEALIDECDAELICKRKWCINGNRYPYRRETYALKKTRKLYMHQAILGINDNRDLCIDHINGNDFDNRRENLRWITMSENLQNMRKKKPNKLGLKGVRKAVNCKGYYARITLNKKQIYLGYFLDPQEAHKAYKKAVIKYHKYAPNNS